MSTPKRGDRVRVAYEGVAQTGPNPWGVLRIGLPSIQHGSRFVWAATEHCEVLAPPVQVGDVVTEANVDQLKTVGTYLFDPATICMAWWSDAGWIDQHGNGPAEHWISNSGLIVDRLGGES